MDKLVVGYVRCSTLDQQTERQNQGLNGLRKFDRIYEDKVSGAVKFSSRPYGSRLIQDVKDGLVGEVWFWETSRIGRDLSDILSTLDFFADSGVQVNIVKEGIRLLDDDGKVNPTTRMVLSVMGAVSTLALNHIKEAQKQGIAVAKARGVYLGRKHGTKETIDKFLNKKKNKDITRLLNDGVKSSHISSILGVSQTTINKVKVALKVK